jgi:hypothetical protein
MVVFFSIGNPLQKQAGAKKDVNLSETQLMLKNINLSLLFLISINVGSSG